MKPTIDTDTPAEPPRERLDHETRTAQIYQAAARLFCEQGFGQASMSDVATATGMTKAGVYHHIESKDELLYGIMSYGMDLFEEKVYDRVVGIGDPLERLRETIRAHVLRVTRDRPKELTVVLNETVALKGEYLQEINRRRRRYVRLLERTFQELIDQGYARAIDPRVATFALTGMINWIYQWYQPTGRIRATELADSYVDLFLGGVLVHS